MTGGESLGILHFCEERTHLRDALVLVVEVHAVPRPALAGVRQARIARVIVHAQLLALRDALGALIDVHALLAIGAQPQALPAQATGRALHLGSRDGKG